MNDRFEELARTAGHALDQVDGGAPRPATVRRLRARRRAGAIAGMGVLAAATAAAVIASRNDGPRINTLPPVTDPITSSTTGASTPADEVALLVATDGGFARRTSAATALVVENDAIPVIGFRFPDGSMLTQVGEQGEREDLDTRLEWRHDGEVEHLDRYDGAAVLGAGLVGGKPAVVLASSTQIGSRLLVVELTTGRERDAGIASGGFSGVAHADVVDDRLFLTTFSDCCGGSFLFAGGVPDVDSLLPQRARDYLWWVAASDDGSEVAFLSSTGDPSASGTRWILVVADLETREITTNVEFDLGAERATWFDFDGRWAVVSGGGINDSCPACLTDVGVIIDTAAAAPTPVAVPLDAMATIDRSHGDRSGG